MKHRYCLQETVEIRGRAATVRELLPAVSHHDRADPVYRVALEPLSDIEPAGVIRVRQSEITPPGGTAA